MGEKTSVGWTDSMFSPWIGCANVSPGCDHCYAEALSTRFKLAEWGPANAPVRSDTETSS
jgi:protein gp37